MKNSLLIPYAICDGNVVHISEVERGEACGCYCPVCQESLISRKGEVKQHHFAHKPDSNCSGETVLHQLGKLFLSERISTALSIGDPIPIEWSCKECSDVHQGNLVKKAVSLVTEISFGSCRPDIALLNSDGDPVVFIEVVVTHSPDENVLEYASNHNIHIVQFRLKSVKDLEALRIEELLHPSSVDACTRQKCKKCGKPLYVAYMYVFYVQCWNCKEKLKIASTILADCWIHRPNRYSEKMKSIAMESGIIIREKVSEDGEYYYFYNVCPKCDANIGMLYEYSQQEIDRNLRYSEYGCIECDYWIKD